jgi:hypothetical protein
MEDVVDQEEDRRRHQGERRGAPVEAGVAHPRAADPFCAVAFDESQFLTVFESWPLKFPKWSTTSPAAT